MQDNKKRNNIHIIGIPGGEEKEKGIENLFEKVMTENDRDIYVSIGSTSLENPDSYTIYNDLPIKANNIFQTHLVLFFS